VWAGIGQVQPSLSLPSIFFQARSRYFVAGFPVGVLLLAFGIGKANAYTRARHSSAGCRSQAGGSTTRPVRRT
jgi:hypothetical protein